MGIVLNDSQNLFMLQTRSNSYAFGIDNQGLVRHLYWGSRINAMEDFEMPELAEVSTNDPVYEITKEEFPIYGGLRYKEHCLKVTFADGTRDVAYEYVNYEIQKNEQCEELVIILKDKHYALVMELHYKIYEAYDLMERFVVLKNESTEVMQIEKLHSGQFHVPYEGLNFRNVHGHWGAEQQKFVQKVDYGKIIFENRRGISSHNHNPYFILDQDATETTGNVYFGALRMTGNFSGAVEQTQYGETLVQMGINTHDFTWDLKPGESFASPEILCGYSADGFQTMSHNLHQFANDFLLREGLRPVLYNSWEATGFDVTVQEQKKLAAKAKELGAELFVVDDGWFGQRHGIDNGLGDWYVNKEKFPNGIDELIDEVKAQGLLFGIWVEPEMVNPKAELYAKHPDWIYHFDTRESDTSREQYVLDLTKNEVKAFVLEMLDNLLSNHEIDYIKWDMNRSITECYSIAYPADQQGEIFHRYILGVYDLYERLTSAFPEVLFESCASGGGRFEPGMLYYAPQGWGSDDSDAVERLKIQYGTSMYYPLSSMGSHVSVIPNHQVYRNTPLHTRANVAYFGTFGYELDLNKLSDAEIEEVKAQIRFMKEYRELLQFGTFYRLKSSFEGNETVWMVVNKDKTKALVGYYRVLNGVNLPYSCVKLRGLDPDKLYENELANTEHYGDELMNLGLITTDVSAGEVPQGAEPCTDFESRIYLLKEKQDRYFGIVSR